MATIFLNIFSLFLLLHFSPTSARIVTSSRKQNVFSIDLIHRDSPSSPLYYPTFTLADRARQAAERSFSRLAHFSGTSTNGIVSKVVPGPGEYFMKLGIGTPAVEFLANLDTGSDLIWTQCLPCENCFKQTSRIFDPRRSSTYRNQGCNSSFCSAVNDPVQCDDINRCDYSYGYGDGSYTKGNIALETFTFRSSSRRNVSLLKVGFGCGHDNVGTFEGSAGLVGLGRGPISLVSQLGSSVDNKFSYCLNSMGSNSSSLLIFGKSPNFPGTGKVRRTPIVKIPAQKAFYYLTLNDLSVGKEKLNIPSGIFAPRPGGDGGVIIDSGTTLTLLVSEAYDVLEPALKRAIKLKETTPVQGSQLCFNYEDESDLRGLPNVTFHFHGADWVLPPSNAFLRAGDGVVCSAIVPISQFTIFGNVAQQNVHVEYDLGSNVLSFVPTDCSRS